MTKHNGMSRNEWLKSRRVYGTKRWADLRKAVFQRDRYACQMCGGICYGTGRANPLSPECDHIKPHKGDPALMWGMDNLQTLHKKCHSIKTTIEDGGMQSGAQTHPTWLPKPACDVTVVCGPPGAGKTTWAKAQATVHDDVIDLDDCFKIVCGTHGHNADKKHLSAAIRVRNKMLANLASKRDGRAFFIVSAPTKTEREWWSDLLGARIHLIKPEPGVIGGRDIRERRKELAADWYMAETNNNWRPPAVVRQVGLDGYPVK